jgi:hypothetical protein
MDKPYITDDFSKIMLTIYGTQDRKKFWGGIVSLIKFSFKYIWQIRIKKQSGLL